MEADWEFEVGGDAPVIDACWAGFVDLRGPLREGEMEALMSLIPEAVAFPALAKALMRLNGKRSPVWTAKCDFWPALEAGEFDPDEMDAAREEATHAAGCYIDILPCSDQQWVIAAKAAADCRFLCVSMKGIDLRGCRLDLMIRGAVIAPDVRDLGITAYLTGCGASGDQALGKLAEALGAFTDAVDPESTVEWRSSGE